MANVDCSTFVFAWWAVSLPPSDLVSIQLQGKRTWWSVFCNFYCRVLTHTIVQADPCLRQTFCIFWTFSNSLKVPVTIKKQTENWKNICNRKLIVSAYGIASQNVVQPAHF